MLDNQSVRPVVLALLGGLAASCGNGGPATGPSPARPAPAACPGGDAPAPRPCSEIGVTVDPAYADRYGCVALGPVPGLPARKYGGLTLARGTCNTLLIGGDANSTDGKLYAIEIRRDAGGHVSGFQGTATVVAAAPFNDAGIAFGPGGVLFLARWPRNELQQIRPGSMTADKVTPLAGHGVAFAAASLAFVPRGLPGAGLFKLVAWPHGEWYTVDLAPDGQGTYEVSKVTTTGRATVGGPEGFAYVEKGNPLFDGDAMLVAEWTARRVSTYAIDEHGEPLLDTRKELVSGFRGAQSAYRDPTSGDFLFATWGESEAAHGLIAIRGFQPFTSD